MLYLLLISLLLSSCSGELPPTEMPVEASVCVTDDAPLKFPENLKREYFIDTEQWPEERQDIKNGLDMWNSALDRDIIDTGSEFGDTEIVIRLAEDETCATGHAATASSRAGDSCLILVNPCYVDLSWPELYAHEIGHCLGFGHSSCQYSIMGLEVGADSYITDNIVDKINSYKGDI